MNDTAAPSSDELGYYFRRAGTIKLSNPGIAVVINRRANRLVVPPPFQAVAWLASS
jgi:hypothetical protein